MDLTAGSLRSSEEGTAALVGKEDRQKETQPAYVSMVDPFLVEALQNPRHRLTILRMEIDLQKFLQNSDQPHFEFQQFPTSYLRLAAHRVAQHYDLQTMVLDNGVGGSGIRILAMRKPESKLPVVRLCDVPAKEPENCKLDQIKIVIRPRPRDQNGSHELRPERCSVRSVEDRKEEYDKARARIFSSSSGSESDRAIVRNASDRKNIHANENEASKKNSLDIEKNVYNREVCNSSRVAIFRDREKDRTDPDYDRNYDRYVRSTQNNLNLVTPYGLQKFQAPVVNYESISQQLGHVPPIQTAINYSNPVMNPYSPVGLTQIPRDALYVPWPTQTMMYAQSYDQLRHAFFQASCQPAPKLRSCTKPLMTIWQRLLCCVISSYVVLI